MNSTNYHTLIDRFNNTSIMVIGDIMLDRFIFGNVSQISPEAPVPLVDVSDDIFQLGGAANAVKKIQTLGGGIFFSGIIGNDWIGRKVIELLVADKIETSGIISCDGRYTTIKSRVIAKDQQILRYDRENREPVSSEYSQKIMSYIKEKIDFVDLILVSDYKKGVVTRQLLEELVHIAHIHKKPVILYPKIQHSCGYKGVNLVITSIENACEIADIKQINETSVRNMGHWLLSNLKCDQILINRGTEGMAFFNSSGEINHIKNILPGSIQTLGSMDIIASIIAMSLPSCPSNMIDAVNLANMGVEIFNREKGSVTITQNDLFNQIQKTGESHAQ